MHENFKAAVDRGEDEHERLAVAHVIRDTGRLLVATEIRAAQFYWHNHDDDGKHIYPAAYTPPVVGMLWTGLVQLQTWFGASKYLCFGIQVRHMI